jgi:16S rRNA (uracil1498-N3)-methyltransferase
MRRFVLPAHCAGDGQHKLSGKPFHYLCRVRRSPVGAVLSALDESGRGYSVTIIAIGDDSCRIDVRAVGERTDTRVGPRIVLYQGLPKGRKLEQVIRQCTEAGVAEIRPFTSRYTVTEAMTGARGDAKLDRWNTIAREAVQQSGRLTVPVVHPPVDITDIPEISPLGGNDNFSDIGDISERASLGLLFHQEPLEHDSLHGYLKASPQTVTVVIGGEGGFSSSEVDFMTTEKGYHLAYLGPTVLRTETAAIYAVAAVQTILREIEAWSRK